MKEREPVSLSPSDPTFEKINDLQTRLVMALNPRLFFSEEQMDVPEEEMVKIVQNIKFALKEELKKAERSP
jgi:hypothetical protein